MFTFLRKILLFPIPIILLLLMAELYVAYTPNAFNTKAKFIKENNDVEAIFLGSSHTMNGINPEFLSVKAANLAYGSQDYQIDSALFFSYIEELPDIKYVFIEIDYHNLERKNPDDFYRLCWYNFYHGIEFNNSSLIDKYFLYQSNPAFFNQSITKRLNPFSTGKEINKFGFITNDFSGVFQDFNYNDVLLQRSASKRLRNRGVGLSEKHYNFNKRKIGSVIDYCLKNNIKVFLVKIPIYSSYTRLYNKERNRRRDSFIEEMLNFNGVSLLNYENDKRFITIDFLNDDHLNSHGAKKLTQILNSAIMDKKQNAIQESKRAQ